MPLDSSGNAQLLPGATNAAPLTKIKSQQQHNDLWADFASMISAKLDADGRKPATGKIRGLNGTDPDHFVTKSQLDAGQSVQSKPDATNPDTLIASGKFSVLNPVGLDAGTWTITVENSPADLNYLYQKAVLANGGAFKTVERRRKFDNTWEIWSSPSAIVARVFNTYVDASSYGVNPASPDISPALQVAIDENPGKTIVIPNFGAGQTLKSLTPVYLDNSGTFIHFGGATEIIRPLGVALKQPIIAIRKRVAGGATLTDVGVTGRGKFFFEPVSVHGPFVATAGQTVFPMASVGQAATDFVVVRTRGAAKTFLSQSSDFAAVGPTGFTLATPALAGDILNVAIVLGDARTCAVLIEGTAADPVGSVTLSDYEVDGTPYLANSAQYVRDLKFERINTYGCVDRGSIYPYLGVGKLSVYRAAAYGIPRRGFGAGSRLLYYGLNFNDLAGDGFPIENVKVLDFQTQDTTSHGIGLSGDVRRAAFSDIATKNSGLYALLCLQGATEPEYTTFDGFDADGSQNEIAYLLSERLTVKNFVGRNGGSFRVGGSGVFKSENNIQADIFDSTSATDAVLIQDQIDMKADIRVFRGAATNMINCAGIQDGDLSLKAKHTNNAGEGIILSNVQASKIKAQVRGRNRGALLLGNSRNNDLDLLIKGNATTGFETTAGSYQNRAAGIVQGQTFNVIDNAGDGGTPANANQFSQIRTS